MIHQRRTSIHHSWQRRQLHHSFSSIFSRHVFTLGPSISRIRSFHANPPSLPVGKRLKPESRKEVSEPNVQARIYPPSSRFATRWEEKDKLNISTPVPSLDSFVFVVGMYMYLCSESCTMWVREKERGWIRKEGTCQKHSQRTNPSTSREGPCSLGFTQEAYSCTKKRKK